MIEVHCLDEGLELLVNVGFLFLGAEVWDVTALEVTLGSSEQPETRRQLRQQGQEPVESRRAWGRPVYVPLPML